MGYEPLFDPELILNRHQIVTKAFIGRTRKRHSKPVMARFIHFSKLKSNVSHHTGNLDQQEDQSYRIVRANKYQPCRPISP